MLALLLIALFLCFVVTKLVRNYRVRCIIVNNDFIKSFLSSDDYLAKEYAERSKLKEFQIIEFSDLKDDKMKRSYYRQQEKALDGLKECFKSYCAWNLIVFENPHPQFLMDVERECLSHHYCTEKCPYFCRYRTPQCPTVSWGIFLFLKFQYFIF